jgi:hypothetical protein
MFMCGSPQLKYISLLVAEYLQQAKPRDHHLRQPRLQGK